MAVTSRGGADGRRGVVGSGQDAVQLTIEYVKQETLGPLKVLGRFVLFGVAATVLLATGTFLALLGLLRLLQTETGLTGNLSWVPYLIVTAIGLLVVAVAGWRVVSGPAARRAPATGTAPTAPAAPTGGATTNGGT